MLKIYWKNRHLALAILFGLSLTLSCKSPPQEERGKKILHMSTRSKIGDMDPVSAGHAYASLAMSLVYETLFDYKYLKRPYELEPLLLESMPEISEDSMTYTFKLRAGIHFHDDPSFPGGKGREIESKDVIYSMKRMANREFRPRGWWLYNDRIKGFNEYRDEQAKREKGTPFDYDKPVSGLEIVDKYTFRIHLTQPYPQFLFVLAMPYTVVVAREAVEHYGPEFNSHPVGTGPFTLKRWVRGTEAVYERNPNYRTVYHPTQEEASAGMAELGVLKNAGKQVPMLDGVVIHVFEQDQPMWLKWRVKDLDYIQVPAEYHDAIFQPDGNLRQDFVREGVSNHNVALLDFIYRGFNMEHPITGGEKGKLIRQAIALAFDIGEVNDAFYNNTCVEYDGPIPPGLDGYVAGVTSPYRGPNIKKAKELLAKAGYPEGKGLPPIQYEIAISSNSREQAEMLARQLKKIGITLEVNANSFPELIQKLSRRKAQFFGLAWGSDYPDAENNLALFYGPNSSPGSNNFNYQNPKYDAIYEKARVMQPSPERTQLYKQMREMLIEDVPSFGSMGRTRFYVWNDRLDPFLPAETWYRWIKYLNVKRTQP